MENFCLANRSLTGHGYGLAQSTIECQWQMLKKPVPETGTSYLVQVSWVSVISISMESTTVVVVVVVVHRGVNQWLGLGQRLNAVNSTVYRARQ